MKKKVSLDIYSNFHLNKTNFALVVGIKLIVYPKINL